MNRAAAARYGLTVGDVQRAITSGIGGENIAENIEGRERYPISIRYAPDFRDDIQKLARVVIVTPTNAEAVGKGQRDKVVNADRAVDDPMRDRLHRLRLVHRFGMKFPQRASPVDRKLGDYAPGDRSRLQKPCQPSKCSIRRRHRYAAAPHCRPNRRGRRAPAPRTAEGYAEVLPWRATSSTGFRISRDRQGLAALSGATSPALERSGCFASTCTLVHADIPATSTGCNNRDMPEGCCVLLFRNAQVLLCWPVHTGRCDRRALTASLATAQRRILAAFRHKIQVSSCSNLPGQLSLKHAN